ncbi:MAG: hypothetical protein ACLTDP_09070 [Terrisporobacter sp.]
MEIKSILSTIEHLQNQVSKLDEKIAVLLRSLGTTIETIRYWTRTWCHNS